MQEYTNASIQGFFSCLGGAQLAHSISHRWGGGASEQRDWEFETTLRSLLCSVMQYYRAICRGQHCLPAENLGMQGRQNETNGYSQPFLFFSLTCDWHNQKLLKFWRRTVYSLKLRLVELNLNDL